MKLCIIDNDEKFIHLVTDMLARRRDEKMLFKSAAGALTAIKRECPDGLIWNLALFRENDIETLREIRRENPGIVVALTGEVNGNPVALQLLDHGTCEFLRRPVTPELISAFLRKMDDPSRLSKAAGSHASHLVEKYRLFEIIGKSPEMIQVYEQMEMVSKNQGTVLIRGERGTCRELMARAIHQNSARRKRPFVKFPCSIVPEGIFDDELFGHGSHGDDGHHSNGRNPFENAAGGTLLLDEIEHIPLETQIRLVDYFQARASQHPTSAPTDAGPPRIIASSSVDLRDLVQERKFRHELFYRINVLPIDIPPLRNRPNDIPVMVEYFLKKYSPKSDFEVHPDAMKILVEYEWPGNARHLESFIERLVLTVSGGVIFRHHLPEEITRGRVGNIDFDSTRSLEEVVDDVERLMIKKALYSAKGNMKLAARNLKVPYSTFRIKMRKFNLT